MAGLSYDDAGATRPRERIWSGGPAGYRQHESSVLVGSGQAIWTGAREALLAWGVKTRSGFTVIGDATVREGADVTLVAELGPLRIHEPARVVSVVDEEDRAGFAYGTRLGHPVSGEEAFILTREPNGDVVLTLRSLTRAPRNLWLLAYPAALLAQRLYRRRYSSALK